MAKREDLKQVIVISNKDTTGNPSGSIMKDKKESMPFSMRKTIDPVDGISINEDSTSEVKEGVVDYQAKIEHYTSGI